jgi:Ser-tRNA(Ala) deacylase AlaX
VVCVVAFYVALPLITQSSFTSLVCSLHSSRFYIIDATPPPPLSLSLPLSRSFQMSAAATSFVRVGELACQKNSFLRELTATVVSCDPAKAARGGGKKKAKGGGDDNGGGATAEFFDVVLSDSVLFPEGGGQPCDYGTLSLVSQEVTAPPVAITNVRRVGDTCVLTSPVPFTVGATVHQAVDWPRRLDHMQHHTGQHLLTAVVERKDTLHLPTISWSLTHPFCFIQVDVGAYATDPSSPYHRFITKEKKISDDMIAKIEDLCNAAIAHSTPVVCDVFDSREAYQQEQDRRAASPTTSVDGAEESAFRSRGIPEDVTGPIRIISLPHIDSCTCCGTHLHTLAELHAMYLLHQEVKGTTVKLHFVTGARAAQQFHTMYVRERQLMPELGGTRPEDFVSVVQRRSKDMTDAEKTMKRWTLELAGHEARRIIAEVATKEEKTAKSDAVAVSTVAVVVPLRRDDVDLDFFNEVRQQLDAAGYRRVVLVAAWAVDRCIGSTITNAKDVAGQVFITGGETAADMEKVVTLAKETLEGLKGGTSKFGFRGKGSLKEWDTLVKRLHA